MWLSIMMGYRMLEIDGIKVNVMSAIDMMVESLKRIILGDSDEKLILPIVLLIVDL